jgi:hypothetical protein
MNYRQLARVTDEEVAAMSAEELARFGHELRMAELEQRSVAAYWRWGMVLWTACIVGLTIHHFVR